MGKHAPVPADIMAQLNDMQEHHRDELWAADAVVGRFDSDSGKPVYCLPAGVKLRLRVEVAELLLRHKGGGGE